MNAVVGGDIKTATPESAQIEIQADAQSARCISRLYMSDSGDKQIEGLLGNVVQALTFCR